MQISYGEVRSRFFEIVNDPKFFSLDESIATEYMNGWLRNAVSDPYIRAAFSSISLYADVEQIEFTLKNPVSDEDDILFVSAVISQFMKLSWMEREVDSALNIAFIIGGKEQKKIQSNYKSNIERCDSLRSSLRKQIRDYGYQNNDYIGE